MALVPRSYFSGGINYPPDFGSAFNADEALADLREAELIGSPVDPNNLQLTTISPPAAVTPFNASALSDVSHALSALSDSPNPIVVGNADAASAVLNIAQSRADESNDSSMRDIASELRSSPGNAHWLTRIQEEQERALANTSYLARQQQLPQDEDAEFRQAVEDAEMPDVEELSSPPPSLSSPLPASSPEHPVPPQELSIDEVQRIASNAAAYLTPQQQAVMLDNPDVLENITRAIISMSSGQVTWSALVRHNIMGVPTVRGLAKRKIRHGRNWEAMQRLGRRSQAGAGRGKGGRMKNGQPSMTASAIRRRNRRALVSLQEELAFLDRIMQSKDAIANFQIRLCKTGQFFRSPCARSGYYDPAVYANVQLPTGRHGQPLTE
jgi:hypothetical protein